MKKIVFIDAEAAQVLLNSALIDVEATEGDNHPEMVAHNVKLLSGVAAIDPDLLPKLRAGFSQALTAAVERAAQESAAFRALLQEVEAALAEGQTNVAGTDDPDAEPDSAWASPLRKLREAMTSAGIERATP